MWIALIFAGLFSLDVALVVAVVALDRASDYEVSADETHRSTGVENEQTLSTIFGDLGIELPQGGGPTTPPEGPRTSG